MNTKNTKRIYEVAFHSSGQAGFYCSATDRDDAWRQFQEDSGTTGDPTDADGVELAPRSNHTIEPATSRKWTINDGGDSWVDELSPEPDKALEQAEETVRAHTEKPHHSEGGTTWVVLWIESCGDELRKTLDIDPVSPACQEGISHEWEQDDNGVSGHGGGVIITSTCKHCKLHKTIDTWAQNPSTGEEGLHSVRYDDNDQEASDGPSDEVDVWIGPYLDDGDDSDDEDEDEGAA